MVYNSNTLPALKLTQRPTFGFKSVGTIHRGHSCPDKTSRELLDQFDHVSPSCQYDMTLDDFIPTATVSSSAQPTEHELECKSSVAGWKEIQT